MVLARSTALVESYLGRLRAGDLSALNPLLTMSAKQLNSLGRRLLQAGPSQVRRFDATNDAFQGAIVRLCRALASSPPANALRFYRLAALQFRRELIDLAERLRSTRNAEVLLVKPFASETEENSMAISSELPETRELGRLAEWTEFHATIQSLPESERIVADLLYYQGLDQEEAAQVLDLDLRTLQNRWHEVKNHVYHSLRGAVAGN